MTLFEVNQAAAIIKETAHPEVNLIFGAVIDPNLGDDIRVTVIATGFERTGVPRRTIERPATNRDRGVQRGVPQPGTSASSQSQSHAQQQQSVEVNASVSRQQDLTEFQPRSFNTDDLDIPAFLRRR
jgi:cell division protein FtsZ